MNAWLIEALGYTAAGINVFVYVSNSMVPLRIAAIFANALFAAYFYLKGVYPLCLLNATLLLVNVWRLRQLQHLIEAIRAATRGDFKIDWLRPFMRTVHIPTDTSLYRKGDLAEEAFVIVRGAIELPEVGVTLGAGALFGEIGLFTDENRRTASAIARSDAELLSIEYSDVTRLAAQNPRFAFYLMRLMVQRMQRNIASARAKTS
ncbi:MAG: cyclic nucleotide-binding domain-containing protein [Methylocystis sp.]